MYLGGVQSAWVVSFRAFVGVLEWYILKRIPKSRRSRASLRAVRRGPGSGLLSLLQPSREVSARLHHAPRRGARRSPEAARGPVAGDIWINVVHSLVYFGYECLKVDEHVCFLD